MSLTPDEDYCLLEQAFIETMVGVLHRSLEEDEYLPVFGYLAEHMVPILAGTRPMDAELPPIDLPPDSYTADRVKTLWRRIMQELFLFCKKTEHRMDDVQHKWILLQIYGKIFESLRAPIVAARTEQELHRV